MKNIYILSSCDEWKSNKSMSLVAATTSLYKLKNAIVHEIKEGNMEYKYGYDKCCDLSVNKQVKEFKEDWKIRGHEKVCDMLEYGYVETVVDGEIQ